jgi:hypothetical protein
MILTLHLIDASSPSAFQRANSKTWSPSVLRGYALTLLLLSFLAIIVTLGILYSQFRISGITSFNPFLMNPNMDKTSVIAMAPYSIISTVITVVLSIWWGSVHQTFRRLQPYISMAQQPTPSSQGTELSYNNYFPPAVAIKAAFHRHWLLALIAAAAMLSEIRESFVFACLLIFHTLLTSVLVIVSISGIWALNAGTSTRSANLTQNMDFRTTPTVFSVPPVEGGTQPSASVLSSVYGNQLANWLYGVWLLFPPDIQNANESRQPLKVHSIQLLFCGLVRSGHSLHLIYRQINHLPAKKKHKKWNLFSDQLTRSMWHLQH